MGRARLVPELCRWPGDLAANRLHPSRGPFVRRQQARLLRCYRAVRLLQAVGWTCPPLSLLSSLRGLTGLVPLDQTTQAAARGLLLQLNREALGRLEQSLQVQSAHSGVVLPVIVSCRQRLDRARVAQEAFAKEMQPGLLRPLIVVGQERQADWSLRFDAEQNLLSISVDDAYEGLPAKVITLVALLALLNQPPQLLKLDDDARPGDLQRLLQLASTLDQPTPIAAGYPIVTPTPLHLDRAWHLGKSRRANHRLFCSLGAREWLSGGAGYLLNAPATRLIQEFWLHTWDFVRSMLYEDVCLSMLLQAGDAQFHWLQHPADLGLFSERQQEVDEGQWSIPDGFLGSSR